jgi:uncharacterized membrane protein
MSLARSLDAGHPPNVATTAASAAEDAQARAAVRSRLNSIDLLRGLVMILMALDHTRDFFGASGANPRDVAEPALFLTRWITHYCAPTFIFLAGISAYLYGARGRSTGEVSRFLVTRGLFLILLEFTVIRFGWTFSLTGTSLLAQVIWVIGLSMVLLAGLVYLPRAALAVLALTLIAGHNLLDGIRPEMFGSAAWVWVILHKQGLLPLGQGVSVYVLYPLIPWVGVMAAGYALGPVFHWEREERRRFLLALGVAVTIGFVVLRATNLYGDPAGWQMQATGLATALSFINCEKYPPSLLYLMMTLGPALMLLAWFEGVSGRAVRWIRVYGRVPLLYYVAHLYLLHILALVMVLLTYNDLSWMFADGPPRKPADYGISLPAIYAVWLAAVAMLYPLCRWFAALKARRQEAWLSYL